MKFLWYEYNNETKHHIFWIFFFKLSILDKNKALKSINEYLTNAINYMGVGNMPPAEGELRQWQLECLELLKEFDKICRENNVCYWLDFGTLLGAMRHKGFIPWDDDIDTSILKTDLDKILPVLKEHFKNTDFIVRERALTCNNFQIRIRHKRYNVGIDVFPVYEYPEVELTDELEKEITDKIIYARKKLDKKYFFKTLSEKKLSKAKQDIINIQNQIILPENKQMPENPILFHGIDFPYEEGYYVMPNDMIFPLRKGLFEGFEFYIPNKAEDYLSRLWKNWNSIPESLTVRYESYFPHYKEGKSTYDKNGKVNSWLKNIER